MEIRKPENSDSRIARHPETRLSSYPADRHRITRYPATGESDKSVPDNQIPGNRINREIKEKTVRLS